MTQHLPAYVATLVVFLAIDYIWLGHVARDFYAREMGDLMRERPNFAVAAVFYTIYAAGIVLFAVNPALARDNWQTAALLGAALGFLAYGTYDVTNLATIKGWPWRMAILDMAWGSTLTALSASSAFWIVKLLR